LDETNSYIFRKRKTEPSLRLKNESYFSIYGASRDVLAEAMFSLLFFDWDYIQRFFLVYRYFFSSPNDVLDLLIREYAYEVCGLEMLCVLCDVFCVMYVV
jgi:hypothetical protein